MPSRDVGGVAANCRGRQSAKWHARREFELLKLVAHRGSEETRELFLRMRLQGHLSPPEAKQAAGRRAKPAPARAQAVPKQKTAAQLPCCRALHDPHVGLPPLFVVSCLCAAGISLPQCGVCPASSVGSGTVGLFIINYYCQNESYFEYYALLWSPNQQLLYQ